MIQKIVSEKISSIIKENKTKLFNEIKETKELYTLLLKWSKEGDVTDEEWKKIKTQLFDVLKTIPALTIFLVPFGSFILLLLIKILPFNILPSSFANHIENKDNLLVESDDTNSVK